MDPTSQDVDLPWPLEINLIKGIKETEVVLPIAVSKVKFTLPRDGSSSSSGSEDLRAGLRTGLKVGLKRMALEGRRSIKIG